MFILAFLYFPPKFQPAVDGVVVACLDLVVYSACVGCDVVGAEEVVDSDIHVALVVGSANAVSGCRIAVGEVFSDACVRVSEWVFVEVAAHDDPMAGSMVGYLSCHRFGLWCAFLGCGGEFVDESRRFGSRHVLVEVAFDEVAKSALVVVV